MRNKHCKSWYLVKNTGNMQIEKTHYRTWNIGRKLKNLENETQTLFKLNWQETLKMGKMRNAHCKTWSMVRKMKIVENEKHTL